MVGGMRGIVLALLALIAPAGAAAAQDREQLPAETRIYPYTAEIPTCDSEWARLRITSLFAWKERNYWNSSLEIERIEHVRMLGFRTNGLDLVPRRYCRAVAVLSNREKLPLHYAIIEDAGIIGLNHDVHFCVEGYDRNWSYPPSCKLAGP